MMLPTSARRGASNRTSSRSRVAGAIQHNGSSTRPREYFEVMPVCLQEA